MTQDFLNRRTKKMKQQNMQGQYSRQPMRSFFPIEYRPKENQKNMYLFALQGESLRVCSTTEHVIMMW